MVKAITPSEAKALSDSKKMEFPEFVIESFNELIVADLKNGKAKVSQKAVVERIKSNAAKQDIILDNADIYAHKYLNIEAFYESAGWKVDYDKPAYNESYDPSFYFETKR